MSRRAKRSGLFHGFWFDPAGKRLGRVSRAELAEAYRLLSTHRDIAAGHIPEHANVGLRFGERMPLG